MQNLKTVLRWSVLGACGGLAIAIILLTVETFRPFPSSVGGLVDGVTFALCPLYILGFSSDVKSMTSLVFITLLGNVFLYGVFFASIAVGLGFLRKMKNRGAQ